MSCLRASGKAAAQLTGLLHDRTKIAYCESSASVSCRQLNLPCGVSAGELLPDGGDAYIQGLSVSRQRQQARQMLGYCPQFDALPGHLTGESMPEQQFQQAEPLRFSRLCIHGDVYVVAGQNYVCSCQTVLTDCASWILLSPDTRVC